MSLVHNFFFAFPSRHLRSLIVAQSHRYVCAATSLLYRRNPLRNVPNEVRERARFSKMPTSSFESFAGAQNIFEELLLTTVRASFLIVRERKGLPWCGRSQANPQVKQVTCFSVCGLSH